MKKEKRYDRKSLRNRLSCIMMVYLDGLGPKQNDKMKKFLDEQLNVVVDHYVMLLKKKNLKMPDLDVSIEQIEKLCPEVKQDSQTEELIPETGLSNVTEISTLQS